MNSEDRRMNEIFTPARDVVASPKLANRVSKASAEIRRKPQSKLVFAFAAGATVLLLGVLTMLPQKARAGGLLERMKQAVEGATSIHAISYIQTKTGWTQSGEIWYAHDDWYTSGPEGTKLYSGVKKWRSRPDQSVVIEKDRMPGEMPENMAGAFSLRGSYAAMNRKGFNFQLAYGEPRVESGKSVITVSVTRPGHDTEREVFVVEKESDLPLRGESQILAKGIWKPRMKWECSYNVPVPAAVFKPVFPGKRIVDEEQFLAEWKKQLGNVLVTTKVDGSPLRIRDIYVNSKGGVFLLWTGKIGARNYRLTLTDSRGRSYTRANFDPGIPPAEWMGTELIYLDSEVLDGAWFVPIEPMESTDSRSYTLTVKRVDMPMPKQNSGRGSTLGYFRPFEPRYFETFNNEKVDPQVDEVANIEIPAQPVSASLLPIYNPFFGDAPHSEVSYRLVSSWALKHYWMVRLGGYRSYEPYRALVPAISLDGESMDALQIVVPRQDLPAGCNREALIKLEELMTGIVERAEAESTYGSSGFDWFELSAVQKALGKSREAEASLRKAEEIRPEVKWRR